MKISTYFSVLLLAATTSTNINAEDRWGLGLGAIISDQGYVDVGNETSAVPIIYYQSDKFQLLGPSLSYNFTEYNDFTFSFIGQYRFDGYEEDDGDIFSGMEERSGSFDLGFTVDYKTNLGDLSFEFITDATNEHKGNELSLSYSKSYNFKSYSLKPYVKFTRQSEDLVDYYYGVRTNETTATRAFHLGETTTNVKFGLQTNWRVGKHHNFIGYASYTAYGSEIKESPLVDASGSTNLMLGYMYAF